MAAFGTVLFALAISLHLLLGRVVSEHLAKIAKETHRRDAIARMWSR